MSAAKRPQYKAIWQLIGLLAWNVPVIAVLFLAGEWAAIAVAVVSLATFGYFRYRLGLTLRIALPRRRQATRQQLRRRSVWGVT